jgi:hypothetical protein
MLMFSADIFEIAAHVICSLCASFTRVFLSLTEHSLLLHLGSIQLKIHASAPNDKFSSSYFPSIDMVPVVFKTADGTATVLMASDCSMADIQRRFAEEICRRSRLSQAAKGHRVSKADTAAAAAEIASEIVITCDGRVLREGTLADACWSAGATIGVSMPQAGGMFSCVPTCLRRAPEDVMGENATQERNEAGGVRSGRSIDRAGINRIVRDVAQKAAKSSKAWRQKTSGGFFRAKIVTSHSLRSAFMNRVDPNDQTSAEIFPGKAPFHPYDWYPLSYSAHRHGLLFVFFQP